MKTKIAISFAAIVALAGFQSALAFLPKVQASLPKGKKFSDYGVDHALLSIGCSKKSHPVTHHNHAKVEHHYEFKSNDIRHGNTAYFDNVHCSGNSYTTQTLELKLVNDQGKTYSCGKVGLTTTALQITKISVDKNQKIQCKWKPITY